MVRGNALSASRAADRQGDGWRSASHTIRGFLADLIEEGIKVDMPERVLRVRTNQAGAESSYAVHWIAECNEDGRVAAAMRLVEASSGAS